MMIKVSDARYTGSGTILALIDGREVSIPDDMANRDRRDLAEWEAEGNVIAPYAPPAPTPADVHTERDRRLALGFDYDFGDERGVHRINTTPADMVGWDEVTKLAQALINVGQPGANITIATGTGIAQVTAMEWQAVLLAAGTFRQQVWGASFMLEAVDPIPDDFAEDGYWNI
jgi:hypothetical protein